MAETNSDTVSVLLRNAGNTGFTQEGASLAVPDGPLGITAADFDGDGRRDLAVASNNAGAVTVLRRQPAGGYGAVQGVTVSRAYGVAVADFDRDSRPDLAVSSDGAASGLTVMLNPGPPAPPPVATPTPTDRPRSRRRSPARTSTSNRSRARCGSSAPAAAATSN